MNTHARPLTFLLPAGLAFLALLAAAAPPPATPESAIRQWPAFSRSAARAMIAKYGEPSQFDGRMLAWFNNGIWRRTIVYRDPVRFPGRAPGRNVLQQTIAYLAPQEKVDELRRFSPRLNASLTAGEMTFTSESEGKNIMAMNLADEIVVGKRDVATAQDFFSKTSRLAASGKSSPYMAAPHFDIDNSRYMTPTGPDQ
jgi:hypothetical protein